MSQSTPASAAPAAAPPARRTPLHAAHVALGARMVPFNGWEMPLSYSEIIDEHHAVRKRAGLFDLCHMGRFRLEGPGRVALLERVCSNRMDDLAPGHARYAVLCDAEGHAIDDVIVYAFPDHHVLVVNAGNRAADWAWLKEHEAALGIDAGLSDRSDALAMLAIQGPLAEAILSPHAGGPAALDAIGYYQAAYGEVLGVPALIARTGYTGEDGFELYFDAARAEAVWSGLLEHGRPRGLQPIGLGARDTLRLEAAMALYGHELTREIDPLEAGLGFAVKVDGRSFVGRDALAAIGAGGGPARRLVCIAADGKRIPREGHPVKVAGIEVGRVTSGTYSPTLDRPIAMALVAREHAKVGTNVVIDVRGKALAAWVARRPFYKRADRGG